MDTGYAGNTKYQKRGEMCKAIKDMLDKSKTEGKLTTLIELVQEDSLSIEKAATKANMTVEQFAKVMKEILEEKEWFLDRISLPGNPRKLTPEEIEQLEKEGRV